MTEQQRVEPATGQQPYMFNTDDYLLLDQSGAFRTYAKTELVGGTIYAVNAQHVRHAKLHGLLFRALITACARSRPEPAVLIEVSIALSSTDMPQADIVLARDLPEDGPLPAERVVLVVEVADSSLDYDLGQKQHSYAAAGIPEYWVADVQGRAIRQMWRPQGEGYAESRTVPFGGPIDAETIAGLTVATASL